MIPKCYQEFLDYMENIQECDHKTIDLYKKNMIDFNNYMFEGSLETTFEDIDKLKVSEIQSKWLKRLKDEEGFLPNTLNNRIVCLRKLYTYMIGEGYAIVNKGKLIPQYKADKKEKPQLETETYISLLNNLKAKRDLDYMSLRNWFMVELFLATGLRRAELVYLDISDIDFDTGMILIIRKYDEGVKFKKQRVEYLPDVVLDDLMYYMEERRKIKSSDDALFLSRRKKRIAPCTINKILDKIAKEYGIKKLYPHMLRGGFASNTINSGKVASHEVAEVMGHSNKTITLNEYHKADKNVLKRVANSNMIFK